MRKNRLEAFSDGVLAIVITIMVLEMKVPHGDTLEALEPVIPVFLGYILSFVYLAIYWNNHHHMLQTVGQVTGSILWANMHLLFWLSLFPFVTGWMGENHFAPLPTLLYGVILLMAGIAYFILQGRIIASEGKQSVLRQAIGHDWKGRISVIAYATAIFMALKWSWIAWSIYILVALMWLIPDRRIERALQERELA